MPSTGGIGRPPGRFTCLLAFGVLMAPPAARAQDTPASETAFSNPPLPAPSVPPPTDVPTASASTPREAELEERVRQLEAMVQRLATQVGQMQTAPGPAMGNAVAGGTPTGGDPGDRVAPGSAGGSGPEAPRGTAAPDVGNAATGNAPSAQGGAAAPGQSLPPSPAPSARFNSPATLDSFRANVKFGPGFEIRSDDDEYILQFHNLTQFEYRGYEQYAQNPVRDTFAFPRQWFMFSGRLTKPFGYFVSLANGFDAVSILDVFADIDYDPRLRIRAGRFKTPFTYEFFVEPIQGLIIPERSIFFNNFGLNRDDGVMAFGRMFKNRFDYAVGIFNGIRNGVLDLDDTKDVAAFLNFRPFANSEGSIFEFLNFGGSVFAGHQNHGPIPQTLRTIVPTTGNAILGVPFLAFNNNVREVGPRAFWDLHAAWYFKQLAVIGEWGSGYATYTNDVYGRFRSRPLVNSFYVQAGYLLTGETRSSVGIVKPKQPFDLRKGKFGLGAWELTGRVETLDIGREVFTRGLSDPNNWTNWVNTVSAGFNWHLTQYLKFYFLWEHVIFGDPVIYAPGQRQLTSDLFLARLQVYF